MTPGIGDLIDAARRGDWSPLLDAAVPGAGKHWAEQAGCSGQDTELFMPPSDGPREDPAAVRRIQGISLNLVLNFCASCPVAVAAQCLVESLQLDVEYGIRAGLLAAERSVLRDAWKRRIDAEAVSAVLRGVPVVLTEAEHEEVIARFAGDPALNADLVARGLGINRKYLWQLARAYKWRSVPAASIASPETDAA